MLLKTRHAQFNLKSDSSDFKSDIARVARFRPLTKGNEDPWYEGVASCYSTATKSYSGS